MKKAKLAVVILLGLSIVALSPVSVLATSGKFGEVKTIEQLDKEIKETEQLLSRKTAEGDKPAIKDANNRLKELRKQRQNASNQSNKSGNNSRNNTTSNNQTGNSDGTENGSENSGNLGSDLGDNSPRDCKEYGPLGIPKWFRGLVDANCEVIQPQDQVGDNGEIVEDGLQRFASILLLNIADMLLRVIGLLAVGFIMLGGFKYMLARGDSNKIVAAKKTITNAIIGLVIAMISMTIVNFVFNFFKR